MGLITFDKIVSHTLLAADFIVVSNTDPVQIEEWQIQFPGQRFGGLCIVGQRCPVTVLFISDKVGHDPAVLVKRTTRDGTYNDWFPSTLLNAINIGLQVGFVDLSVISLLIIMAKLNQDIIRLELYKFIKLPRQGL